MTVLGAASVAMVPGDEGTGRVSRGPRRENDQPDCLSACAASGTHGDDDNDDNQTLLVGPPGLTAGGRCSFCRQASKCKALSILSQLGGKRLSNVRAPYADRDEG